ncbi:MAG: DNA-3-methyladenine glycosylase family protein [Acidimicrobiia bacterium]
MLLRNGGNDPTTRVTKTGSCSRIERATLTPDGPGAVAITVGDEHDAHAVIRVEAWGDGADWLRARALGLCARDTNEIVATGALRGHHAVVDAALRRFGILHLPSTGTPYHEVLPAILGQRITAAQALSQWVRLCERYGELAPGPLGLRLPPTPQALLRVASWEFHRLGIEEQRVRTLRIAARHAGYIDRTREMCGADARSALTKLPGIGPWTAAVTVGTSHGDPDALPIGDFHVKNTVAWALTGRARGTDDEMLAALAPYAGQRWRVVRMLEKSGCGAPKFGPKRRLLDIAAL